MAPPPSPAAGTGTGQLPEPGTTRHGEGRLPRALLRIPLRLLRRLRESGKRAASLPARYRRRAVGPGRLIPPMKGKAKAPEDDRRLSHHMARRRERPRPAGPGPISPHRLRLRRLRLRGCPPASSFAPRRPAVGFVRRRRAGPGPPWIPKISLEYLKSIWLCMMKIS